MSYDPGGPLLGALLRLCHAEVQAALDDGFARAHYPRLHGAATQPLWDAPDGLRLTQLAHIAGVSKQAMAEMVEAMVEAGYIERVADPTDGRARRLRLTKLGRDAGLLARKLVREVEARWETRVGKRRVAALRETLAALAGARGNHGA
jgi:DNA-binding MarR family transcriptional regulator